MLLYNYGNTLIYLYLDLQSEYYQLSLHFIDPCLTTDNSGQVGVSLDYRRRAVISLAKFLAEFGEMSEAERLLRATFKEGYRHLVNASKVLPGWICRSHFLQLVIPVIYPLLPANDPYRTKIEKMEAGLKEVIGTNVVKYKLGEDELLENQLEFEAGIVVMAAKVVRKMRPHIFENLCGTISAL